MTGATARPFAKAFAVAGAFLIASLTALFAWLGPPASSDGAGEAVGRLVVMTGLPALITGLLARRSAKPWSLVKIGLVYGLIFVVVMIVQAVGHARRP